MIKLDNSYNNGTINIAKGGLIELCLEENPSTGYLWNIIDMDYSKLQMVNDMFEEGHLEIGVTGTRLFVFKALEIARTTIVMKYFQPWEGETSSIKEFVLNVHVY